MPRELNPELFGSRKVNGGQMSHMPSMPPPPPSSAVSSTMPVSMPMPMTMQVPVQMPMQMTPNPAVVEFEMAEQYRRKIRDLENQVAVLTQRIDKLTVSLEQRFTQATQAQKAFESQTKEQFGELYSNQAAATSKLTERRMADVKIQEMVDRHNQLVLNFETRMQQVQKVASEQEMKIMTYQATIDEILREIRISRR